MVGTSLSCTTLVFFVTVIVGPSTSGKEWAYRVRRLKSQRLPSTYTESIESSGFAPLAFSFGTGFEVDAGSGDAAGFPVSAIATVGETNIRPSSCTEILVPTRVYARTTGSIFNH